VSITLVILHALLSSVTCPHWPYFYKLSHKRHDFFYKRYWTQNVCFDFLCKCVWNFSRSR